MKKFFVKGTNKEIKVGTPLKADNTKELEILAASGLIDCREVDETKDVSYYIKLIAKRFGSDFETIDKILGQIDLIYPIAAFNIILREIAMDMDKAYPDHIRNSKRIFSVSSVNGIITEIPNGAIRSYKNFAAFRTIEDARKACRITKNILKQLFNE